MCGRITQTNASLPGLFLLPDVEGETAAAPPRYNGAPAQDFWVIRRHPETGLYHRDGLLWGLIPHWCKEANGGRKPINAKCETVTKLPSFRAAYAKRRCLVGVESFFEWAKTKPPKMPYVIGMANGAPFALAGIWENWRRPETGDYIRTFCIITCPANELIATIHDRMPVIIPLDAYDRWLSPLETDPHDLLVPYPASAMRMWPVSSRVNLPKNDDADILQPV